MYDSYLAVVHSPLLWIAAGLVVVLVLLQTLPPVGDGRRFVPWLERPGAGLALLKWICIALLPLWLLLVALFAIGAWRLWLTYPDVSADASIVRYHGGLLLGTAAGLGGLFTLVFAVIRVFNTERQTNVAEESLFNDKINAAAAGLAARRQVTHWQTRGDKEKFKTEWKDDLVTRAAAIDRLEGLVEERPDAAPRVARMLSVYVRELSREHPAQDHPRDEGLNPTKFQGMTPDGETLEAMLEWAGGLTPVRSDMEKAAQTLGRLKDIAGVVADDIPVDLRDANLQGFDLKGLCFDKAQMSKARMEGARLYDSRMQGVQLDRAWMQGVNLSVTQMQGAKLIGAQMQGADLSVTQMQGAKLIRAQMQGANLFGARMQGAYLGGAQMQGASLSGAQMQGANLFEARMQGANLIRAQMQGANLFEAQMQGADLTRAQLQGANLLRAQMQGVRLWMAQFDGKTDFTIADVRYAAVKSEDFENVNLSQSQVNSLFGDGSVTLPAGLIRPEHWSEEDLDLEDFLEQWHAWQRQQGYDPEAR
ncbi:MAG: pentapeptide repeat-containing protein [Rhodobacteraceae bacterium]|nr:pentapeptide repeat-containing protein [Paracoccaceae bacterium]